MSTTGHGHAAANHRLPEQRAICLLCRDPHSVAEVAAALDVPLGVARVLIDDMAHQGLVVVHGLREGGTSLELLGRSSTGSGDCERRSDAEGTADDLLHDLGRAAEDGLDAGVEVGLAIGYSVM